MISCARLSPIPLRLVSSSLVAVLMLTAARASPESANHIVRASRNFFIFPPCADLLPRRFLVRRWSVVPLQWNLLGAHSGVVSAMSSRNGAESRQAFVCSELYGNRSNPLFQSLGPSIKTQNGLPAERH